MSNHDDVAWDQALRERIGELERQVASLQGEVATLTHSLQNVNDAIIAVNEGSYISAWNRGAELIYGWRADEVLGKRLVEVLENRFMEGQSLEQSIATIQRDGVWRGTVVQRRRDGRDLFVESSVRLVSGVDGPLALVAVNRDVSERASKGIEAVFEHIPAGLAVYDTTPEFRCLRHNASFLHLVGRTWQDRGSVVGVPLHELFDEASYAATRTIFEQVLTSGTTFSIAEYAAVLMPDPQPRYYTWSLSPLRDANGSLSGLLVSALEITDLKRAEEQRLALERRLLETQKLESLGVLAGGIAHDFNNLLVPIVGNAELALLDLPDDAPARPVIEQIGLAARRAADLTRQLLAYAGKGRFVVQPLSLNALIEEMASLLYTSVPRKVALRYVLDPHLPLIAADATQLRQLVMNLMLNAAEACGDAGGAVLLRTSTMWADADVLAGAHARSELPAGDYVLLEVIDNGGGMDAETLARIFDPFFTTKFTGRGLGLSAVHGIVRGHRGALYVDSAPGVGSTFRVLLPVSEQPAAARPPLAAEPAAHSHRGGVLVIDDEDAVLSVTARLLERNGFQVLSANSGAAGLALLEAQPGAVGVVLLDLTMPGHSGEAVFQQLRAQYPDTPVVLISGYDKSELGARFAGSGIAGFVQKPFTAQELCGALTRVLVR